MLFIRRPSTFLFFRDPNNICTNSGVVIEVQEDLDLVNDEMLPEEEVCFVQEL